MKNFNFRIRLQFFNIQNWQTSKNWKIMKYWKFGHENKNCSLKIYELKNLICYIIFTYNILIHKKRPKMFKNIGLRVLVTNLGLTPTLAAWPLCGHTALKSTLWETLFLDKLHDFSLISWNSFLHPF